MTAFAILGSGFGIYGYLPALVASGVDRILLPRRYAGRFDARPELAHLAPRIDWAEDDEHALARADGAVIARRPEDQEDCVARCLAQPSIRQLVLEKPLAPDPARARRLQQRLDASGLAYRIGYTLCHAAWVGRIREACAGQPAGDARLSIRWRFLAHHHARGLDSWKRHPSRGGGALRFYGIQLIALLASLGYDHVRQSRVDDTGMDEADRWEAVFEGPGRPPCALEVDSRSTVPAFAITRIVGGAQQAVVDASDPFGTAERAPGRADPRIAALTALLQDSGSGNAAGLTHAATLRLWTAAEAVGAGTG